MRIVAYAYMADLWCPNCAARAILARTGDGDSFDGWATDLHRIRRDPDAWLSETSYAFESDPEMRDTGHFPQPVFSTDEREDDERCCRCGTELD